MPANASSDTASLVATLLAEFDRIGDCDDLRRRLTWVVCELLQREEDGPLRQHTVAAIDQFFATQSNDTLPVLRQFCRQVLELTTAKRPPRADFRDRPVSAPEDDPSLPPQPTRHNSFAELLPAALVYRVRRLTTFFHRRNPKLARETLPPFLLSPDFDRCFETVIVETIAPAMMRVARFTAQCEYGRQWKGVDTAEFWSIVAESAAMEDRLLVTWRTVWNEFKPTRGKDGRMVAPPELARLRAALSPAEPPTYTLPRLGDDVINLLVRLLSDLREELDQQWAGLVQICEQEVNRRPEVAVEAIGARFQSLPGRLGEFVAMLCHYNVRDVTIDFLGQVVDASAGTLYLPGFVGRGPDHR